MGAAGKSPGDTWSSAFYGPERSALRQDSSELLGGGGRRRAGTRGPSASLSTGLPPRTGSWRCDFRGRSVEVALGHSPARPSGHQGRRTQGGGCPSRRSRALRSSPPPPRPSPPLVGFGRRTSLLREVRKWRGKGNSPTGQVTTVKSVNKAEGLPSPGL